MGLAGTPCEGTGVPVCLHACACCWGAERETSSTGSLQLGSPHSSGSPSPAFPGGCICLLSRCGGGEAAQSQACRESGVQQVQGRRPRFPFPLGLTLPPGRGPGKATAYPAAVLDRHVLCPQPRPPACRPQGLDGISVCGQRPEGSPRGGASTGAGATAMPGSLLVLLLQHFWALQ